jgi:hypothetical protein
VAFEHRHHRGRFALQVDEDRGGRAAVLRAVVDAGEHDERGDRIQVEGDRQQHGDGRHRADAGQHADQRPQQHADQAIQDVLPGERDLRAEDQVVEDFHRASGSGSSR